MQVHRVSYGVKGFVSLARYAIRWTRMITIQAKRKVKILSFWKKYGEEATVVAFGVSRRTLFNWQAALVEGQGKLEALNEQSKRPKSLRKRNWPIIVTKQIRQLRDEHPNLGKDKVQLLLRPFCEENNLSCPSVSTIGNLIKDMGGLRKFPTKVRHNGQVVQRKKVKKVHKPKHFLATHPGHCVALDTVERIVHGNRRYVITFTDLASRFSLAWATRSHASQAAKEFFDLTTFLFPFSLQYVLTDNGSEFMKQFDQEIRRLHLTHWHTYPRTTKMNAHAERFNRTIQEEYIDYHEAELLEPAKFNTGLMKHLLWHNTKRPHWGIKLKTPVQYIEDNYSQLECNMYLTNTHIRHTF